MRIHHLRCGTDCPVGGAAFDGRSKGLLGELVCHCLLIETDRDGLVLVDTGYGLQDVREKAKRLPASFISLLNIRFREEETAAAQVRALGFNPAAVRHILITHLDFDHAGGIEDFPQAVIHVMAREYEAAVDPRRGPLGKRRYRSVQFDEVRRWRRYDGPRGEPWFGFDAVRALEGLPPEILMIPLVGHTWGHAGIAIDAPGGWLLHAGDAYFFRDEVRRPDRRCTPGLRAYQTMMEVDRSARLNNQARLRQLSLDRSAGVRMICGHDVVELEAAQAGRWLV